MEGTIDSIVSGLVDDLIDSGSCQLVRDLAAPLSLRVVGSLMGVPADRDSFIHQRAQFLTGLEAPEGDGSDFAGRETILRHHLPYLGDAELTATTPLADVGLDSMGTIALLLTIETELGAQFPDELLVAETFTTTEALWSVNLCLSTDGTACVAQPAGRPLSGDRMTSAWSHRRAAAGGPQAQSHGRGRRLNVSGRVAASRIRRR